jgi:PAS domain S-box-containing protein
MMQDSRFPTRRVPAQVNAEETAFAVVDSRLAEQPFFGVCVFQDDHFLYANRRFAEFVDRSVEELLSLPSVLDVVYEDDVPEARENIRALLEGESERVRLPLRVRRKDGSPVWLDVQGSRAFHDGRPAIVGVHCDIPEDPTEGVRKLTAKVVRVLSAQVVHDLANVITAIGGQAEVIGRADAEARAEVEELKASVRRAIQLCQRLVRLAGLRTSERDPSQ